MKAKEWQEVSCINIEHINCSNMWAFGYESNQYLIDNNCMVQFLANRNKAILSFFQGWPRYGKMYFAGESKVCFTSEACRGAILSTYDLAHDYWYDYNDEEDILNWDNGQCFFMNNNHYFLDYNESNLYQLKLVEDDDENGHIEIPNQWSLNPTPTEILSVVVLKDTLYYLSENSFYSLKISNNNPVYEPISSVTGIDETSIFVTDYNKKIWILNSQAGVIEYDTETGQATKIAEFPDNTRSTNFDKACLYYNGYLYYIASDNKVYSLEVGGGDNPDYKTKWEKIDCPGVADININAMWGCETQSSQYIATYSNVERNCNLYKFTASEKKATLELAYKNVSGLYVEECPHFGDETTIYDQYNNYSMYKIDLTDNKCYVYYSDDVVDYYYGKSFFIGDNHYFLGYNYKQLYQIEITQPATPESTGAITFNPCGKDEFLTYAPLWDTPIVVLKDTLYYFSESGFCAVKITGTQVESKLVDCVKTTDITSSLVTNKQDKIWIINLTDGVIEYNTKNNAAKTINVYPLLANDTRVNYRATAFYSKDYLYYIANNEVYALNVLNVPEPPTPPTPDNPRKPRMPWIGPITPTIEGGYEFTGLAEFFAMLNEYYLSIMCNGMPMMFTFDPIMHAFHLASKAPHFDPANSNNAFINDKYFYIYNPDRNTITCTNTRTGMSQEIACYENMPEDIIQVVFANNLFFILTQSGENHIARMAGANLEYVSSWKLDNWTPRTGASIVAMKNAIYVFGGKALSDDSKEEPSNTCYNELYVYDFITNASEKLEVDKDVTARYNAKILSNKRWGKLWIIGGKDSTDSLALDIWEYNTRNKEWTYINDIPSKDFNASANYEEKYDNLTLLLTPKANTEQSKFFSMRSKNRSSSIPQASMRSKNRNMTQASSGAVIYQMKGISTATSTKDQSGKSCGCLGLEFFLALVGLFIFRRFRKA